MALRLAGIERESIVDGPGIRVVIFCQGCLRHCEGCHNPGTWNPEAGIFVPIDEVEDIIRTNPLRHGVTFSGGEPFLQAKELFRLSQRLKDYELAAYTGFTLEELLKDGTQEQKKLLSVLDVLIDGPFILSERSLELSFRGSRNQRILNVPESLKAGKAVLEMSSRWTGLPLEI